MNEDKVRDLFQRVTELSPEDRIPFLEEACEGDDALMHELQDLLAADAESGDEGFWGRSALHNQLLADSAAGSAIGQTIGTYRLVELLGRGGMGAVYRAERVDSQFDKCVAIKLVDAVFHSTDLIAQFRAERQILANLDHPNIARLLDGGTGADGLPYLIMEYVEGVPPYDFCREHNLPVSQRLLLFQQICSAVHSAHQHMVIHRDLKPANILVTAEGIPKLLDFGIAKVFSLDPPRMHEALTQPGMLKLTARYASPEQVRGETVTTASDVYSLGVILYELLAEHSPYGDVDRPTHQIMHAVCEEDPVRPSTWASGLKGDLDNIILRALRKSPGDRYGSVHQFADDIQRYLDGRPVLARGDAPLYVAARFIRRNRIAVAAAVLLLCSLVVGLVEVTLARARAERRFNEVRQLAHSVMFDYADAFDRLPGATPVRARLVNDALTYLAGLSKEADTPQLQKEVVDAYVRVSNVQGNEYENNLGDTAAAMASAHKAADAAEKLLREDGAPAALSSSANAFSTYGSLLYSTGDLKSADIAYQRSLDLYRKVAEASPQDLENKISLITCLRHLGDLYGGYGFKNLGKSADALAFYEQAKTMITALSAQFPSNLDLTKEGYKTLLSLTATEASMGRHDEAARDLANALTQIETVSLREPGDTNVKVELAVAESRRGQMLLDDRNAAAAIPHLAKASELLQKLLDADPRNAIYRRGQSVVETQWAAALRGAGQVAEALPPNQRALQIAHSLSEDAPGSAQYRSDVGSNERKLSEALVAAGRSDAALQYAQEAERTLCHSGSTSPDLAACDRALVAVGNAYSSMHQPKSALVPLRKAVEIASSQSAADPSNAAYRSDFARAQAALAAALAQTGDAQAALATYQQALTTWAVLRQANSISAEDAFRSDAAARLVANLKSRH
jgi:tetratricopeptide (TPR) repeat protein